MARFSYFSDIENSTVQLEITSTMTNQEFKKRWPSVKGLRNDSFSMRVGRPVGGGDWMPVTRKIEIKANPSLHECNSKCLNGSHSGKCECKCNGRNHGRGLFTNLLAA
tara:strand:+ start:3054 stop:3377 length:324 start_codon:yes stop_codon:yes gene_type:complete